jgi:alpha-mannosidase
VTHVYQLGHSELRQEVVLTAGSARLDFHNQLHWRETQSMLRARFPVDVHAEDATYEIQFGHIRRPTHRNTTWDLARDEVAAQKWVDVSQTEYGVALLNDCKYGHKVKTDPSSARPVLDLNLLRSVPYSGPRLVQDSDVTPGEPHHAYTDQCDHRFSYALYPHSGDHVAGGVVRAGYELNVPLRVITLTPGSGQEQGDRKASLLRVNAPNVVIEAVKRAEDQAEGEPAWIVRLYECHGAGAQAALCPGFPIAEAAETNLMEEVLGPLQVRENDVRLVFRPFEVKTVRLTPAAQEQEPRYSGTCQSLYTQSSSGGVS